MELRVIEMFAGVGGFRVGLNKIKDFDSLTGLAIEKGEWDFVWANQWEPSTKIQPAFECYKKRFGKTKESISNIDINKVDKREIPDHNLLVGGFPCQDYSVARSKVNEMGIRGKKGVLWWDIVDVLKEKRPSFVLLENVDRLLKSPANKRGRDFAVMLETLSELGYIVQWRMINAGDYGMPQRRRRVFILASLEETKYSKDILGKYDLKKYLINDGFFNDIFPIEFSDRVEEKSLQVYKNVLDISENYKEGKFLNSGIFCKGKVYNFEPTPIVEKYYTLGQVIIDANKYQGTDLEEYFVANDKIEKWKFLKGGKRIPRKKSDGSIYYYTEGTMSFPDNLDLPARTMLTSESTVNRSSHIVKDMKTGKLRTITEVEAEALQMFPYDWTNTGMSRRQRYFMMGNALVTGVISRLEPKLKTIIMNE